MIKRITNLTRYFLHHELITGASIIFIGSLLNSLFNFLFNLFMSRNLTVSDYGILATLISLITLATLPAASFLPAVVNFAASYYAKGRLDLVRGLFFKVGKFSLFLGILSLAILLIFIQEIAKFFNITNQSLIILAGFTIFFGFIGVVNLALLQAKLAFAFVALINLISSFLKLFLGVILVFIGFAVGGAMWAVFFTSITPYILSFIKLPFIFQKAIGIPKISTGHLFTYGAPAAIASFGLMSLINIDIILVKHFFDPKNAGIYAGLSLIGRVIYFLTAPIGTVMFPLITQKQVRGENYHGIFILALLLVFISSVTLTIFYFLFPEFTIRFFIKREEYLVVASLLGLFGIFITIYSLLSVLTYFYLSIRKTEIFIPITIGTIIQAVLIWFYHQSFLQVIIISLSITGLLLASLLLYYWKLYGKKVN